MLVDGIPVWLAFVSSSTFPLEEFYSMYEKINWTKERKVWDREFLWKIRQLLMQFKSVLQWISTENELESLAFMKKKLIFIVLFISLIVFIIFLLFFLNLYRISF